MDESGRPPVDWAANAALFGGREEMGRRFFGRFVELTEPIVAELCAAAQRGDRGETARLAHQIKGGSASVAAVEVQHHSAALEAVAKEGLEGDIDIHLQQLLHAWRRVKAHEGA